MRGTIYLLPNSVDDMVYVGSTVQRLTKRMGNHRANARGHERNSSLYTHMREIGISKWMIEAIKIREVNGKRELEKLEFKCMQNYPQGQLLNTNTVYGEISKESCRKRSVSQRGAKAWQFKRGSISVIRRQFNSSGTFHSYIVFSWRSWIDEKSTHKIKSFSVKKYGERGAMKMAEAFRDTIYPKPE